jgi:hypothetical protein
VITRPRTWARSREIEQLVGWETGDRKLAPLAVGGTGLGVVAIADGEGRQEPLLVVGVVRLAR